MKFIGVRILSPQPAETAARLSEKLQLPCEKAGDDYVVGVPGCEIRFTKGNIAAPQEAQEGYYVGLQHLAFNSTDLPASVKLCLEHGTELTNGEAISYNPKIWGTGMNYVNPVCPDDTATWIHNTVNFSVGLDDSYSTAVSKCIIADKIGFDTANVSIITDSTASVRG